MNWILMLLRHKKDNLSEMPGFLSGDLIALICGEASMLSTSIRKMFHLCMFADFIGGMAQKLHKITALKGDICKQA